MLAKQFWRLEQNPNSLLRRVLKGRYFGNSHPFNAPKATRHSYGWRSIIAANELVTKGLPVGSDQGKTLWCGKIYGYQILRKDHPLRQQPTTLTLQSLIL